MAVAVLKKRVFLDEFDSDLEEDRRILNLAQKVDMVLDPVLDQLHIADESIRPTLVEIHLKNGRILTERKDVAKGYPGLGIIHPCHNLSPLNTELLFCLMISGFGE